MITTRVRELEMMLREKNNEFEQLRISQLDSQRKGSDFEINIER